MRVLHLIPSFAGGGAERQLTYLAPALAALGVETHIGYIHAGPNLSKLSDKSVGLHRILCLGNHDPFVVARIARLIRETRAQVAQTWLLQMDVFGGLAARLLAVPWILSERASAEAYEAGWKFALHRKIGRHASAIGANSQAGLEYWSSLSQSRFNRVIRNIVPIADIESARDARDPLFEAENSGPVILVAGRYVEQKNLFTLLQALDVVLTACPNAKAVFFGEGPHKEHLIGAKQKLSCDGRIDIRGYSDELWSWMKRVSLYVSLSKFEGNPNTVLETMACRCPIVVSDIPTHREILDERSAIFVPVDSVPEIALGIIRALENPSASKSRADAAYEKCHLYTAETVAAQYMRLYEELAISAKPR